MTESWKLTLPCTRAEAETLANSFDDPAATVTVTEPDPARPDEWRLDVYFESKPPRDLLRRIAAFAPSARIRDPRAKPLPPQDWVTLSQSDFAPLIAGRFHVRTPDHAARSDLVDLVIPAGLAFGTGQHATTAGCLLMLDTLRRRGFVARDILDLGTGTGLLAFAAMKLWPTARATASDNDPVSIAVVRENVALNGVRRLHLAVADGLDHRDLIARAPYDLVTANILAAPLIAMAPRIAASVAARGLLILAGLLDTQAATVATAYRSQGMRPIESSGGEWPVLLMRKR